MIRIYNANYTENEHLSSNGLKTLSPLKCVETKSDSEWKIDVEIDDTYFDFIEQNKVIVVKTKESLFQPFRIKNITLDKKDFQFTAYHIAYDLQNYFIHDLNLVSQSGLSFITSILSGSTPANDFTPSSSIATSQSKRFTRISVLEALQQTAELFGAYLIFDNFTITLAPSIGSNRGVVIEYGKNLQGFTVTENWDNVVTSLIPTCGDRVYSVVNADISYDIPYVKTLSFESNYESDSEIQTDVLAQALAYVNKNKYPQVNYAAKSDIVQDVHIGDTILVKATYNLNTTVLAYTYDLISERIISVEFGNYRPTTKNAFKNYASVSDVAKKNSTINQLVIDQTNIINGLYKYGYVVVNDNEIYIVDTLPKEDATYVLRMNLGGIGFSSTGISGTYTSAWTLDGKFNADFIQAGSLNGINLSIGADNTVFKADSNGIYLGNSAFANAPFKVNMRGILTAKSGEIGGWTITNDRLYTGTEGNYFAIASDYYSMFNTYCLWAGSATPSAAKFYLKPDGYFKADSCLIGSWNVDEDRIWVGTNGSVGYIALDSSERKLFFNSTAGNHYLGYDTTYVEYQGLKIGSVLLTPKICSTYIIPRQMSGGVGSVLGDSSYRWDIIYQNSGVVTGSDIRLKENILPLTNAEEFIYSLRPVEYKMKTGTRRHFGFIAQEVQQSLIDTNIGDVGLIVDPMVKPDWDVNNPEENDKEHYLSLRYEELISPIIKTIQTLNERLSILEGR